MLARWLKSLICIAAMMTLLIAAQPTLGAVPIQVDVNGLPVQFDTAPQLFNNRVMVPFRTLAELLDVNVDWLAENQTVIAASENTKVRLQVGNINAYQGDRLVKLDAAPLLSGGRVLVPLRFFSEAFGCQVSWQPEYNQVTITSAPASLNVLAYYALGDSSSSSWEDLFGRPYPEQDKGNTDLVSSIALGWFSLDENGRLLTESRTGWRRPTGWEDVLSAAKSRGLTTEMTIHMVNGNGEITALLSSDEACQLAVEEISAQAKFYDGVNLDLEGLGLSESGADLQLVKDKYSAFAALLGERLHKQGKTLSVSLHAPNSSYRGYDYRALGQICDRIIIMAYDYGTKPEPISMVRQAAEAAIKEVPAHKVLLGISIPSENEPSIMQKVELARRSNLGGIALWRLGLVTDGMWQSLRERVAARN